MRIMVIMKKFFLFFLLFTSPLSAIFSEPVVLEVDQQLFLPAEYYVGDTVELRLSVKGKVSALLEAPADIPDLSWIDIHEITVSTSDVTANVVILFTAFMPGTRTLPPLDLGAGTLQGIRIHVASILDDTNAPPAPVRSQLLLPGTTFGLTVFIGLLFLGPTLVILVAGRGRRAFLSLLERRKGKRPVRRLFRLLKELEENLDSLPGRDFYLRMGSALRRYLTDRVGEDFLSATGREFHALCFKMIDDRALSHALSEMVLLSERIKFGGQRVESRRKMSDLELVRSVASYVEQRADAAGRRPHRKADREKRRSRS
jgi:hypothetical protein